MSLMIYNIRPIEPEDPKNYLVFSIEEDGSIKETKIPFSPYFYVENTIKAKDILSKYNDLILKTEPFKYEIDGTDYRKVYLINSIRNSRDLIYGLKNYGCKIFENDITPLQQFMYENKIRTLKDKIGIEEVPYVVFDIEVETKSGVFPSPDRNFVFYIGASGVNNKREKVEFYRSVANYESSSESYTKGEEKLLDDFLKFLNDNHFIIISGYNIYNFDIWFIDERLKKYNKKFAFNNDELIFQRSEDDKNGLSRHPLGGTKNVIKYRRYVAKNGRVVIFDLYYYLYRMPSTLQEIRYRYGSVTLKNVSDYYDLIKKENRQMIEGSKIYETFVRDGPIATKYLVADVESTRMLYEKFVSNMFFLANEANMGIERIFDASSTQILESALIKETKDVGIFVPQKTYEKISEDSIKNYGGGYTDIHAVGFFENVTKLDFSSLYPSIMLDWHIKPKNDFFGIFTKTLEKLYTKRIEYKHTYNKIVDTGGTEEENRKAKDLKSFYKSGSDALKILINSAYGLLGFRRGDLPASRFTDLDAASQVTTNGRNLITSVEDVLLKNGFIIIETDTDGVYITETGKTKDEIIKDTKKMAELINIEFKKLGKKFVSIDFEDNFDVMVSVKKKNYFLVKEEKGKMVLRTHGSKFVNSADSPVQKEILNEMIEDITINKLNMQELQTKYKYLFISSPLKPEEDFITKYSSQPEMFLKTLRAKSLESYATNIDIIGKRALTLYFADHGTYPLEGTDIKYYFVAVGGKAQREKIELGENLDKRKIDYKKYLREIKQKFIEIILDAYDTSLRNSEKIKVEKRGNITVRKSTSNPYYQYLFEKDWMNKFFTNITDKHRMVIMTTFRNHFIRGANQKSIFGHGITSLIIPEFSSKYIEYLKEKILNMPESEKSKLINKYAIYSASEADKNSINYIQVMNDLSEEEYIIFNIDNLKTLLVQQSKQET